MGLHALITRPCLPGFQYYTQNNGMNWYLISCD